MEKAPRKLNFLLLMLLTNLAHYIPEEGGICNMIGQMRTDGLITTSEEQILNSFIQDHKPEYDHSLTGAFWWPAYELEPRIDFIHELIAEINE